MEQIVCKQGELRPGQTRTIVTKGKVPVVVVCNEKNEYYAVRGICPHQGAMLGAGQLTSLTVSDESGVYELAKHGEVLRCPWHSFDYDVVTGQCVSDPRLRVKTYPVRVKDEYIVVYLGAKS